MAAEGLRSVVTEQRHRTMIAHTRAEFARDLVRRQCHAEHSKQMWVANFTNVAVWLGSGYVTCVIDVFSRRIIGWRAHTRMRSDLLREAFEKALHDGVLDSELVVHLHR